jgi:sulfite oxidase
MLGEMNVNSVICSHGDGESVQAGPLTVSGYSMAGGGRAVARVEVSPDGGSTWIKAELSHNPSPWAWTLWTARLDLKPGKYQLTVRAIDTAINTQPMQISQVWNFKGYMNNAWHRVNILVN